MANFSKQQISSKQRPNKGQNKSLFEPRKLPSPNKDIHPTATTDLLGYQQPQSGETIANIRRSLETGTASRQDKPVSISNPATQLKATKPVSIDEVAQPKLIVGRSDSFNAPTPALPQNETVQRKEGDIPNQTGLPDNLKAGIENLSGYSLYNVRVHYNSSKPAQLQALAYTQGSDIHVAPGQEKHLPHEAWHVVQQKQGRVKPTMQLKEAKINDDEGLEKEADVMGAKALQMNIAPIRQKENEEVKQVLSPSNLVQGKFIDELEKMSKEQIVTALKQNFKIEVSKIKISMLKFEEKDYSTLKEIAENISPKKASAKSASSSKEVSTTEPPSKPATVKAEKPPIPQTDGKIEVLSDKSAQRGQTKKVSPAFDNVQSSTEDCPSVKKLLNLYEKGNLLVTSTQDKDLHKVHDDRSRQAVAKHIKSKKMTDVNSSEVDYAKVNWTMTSPRMQPHYYGMTDHDKTPKEPNQFKPGGRIATLVDATHDELRYMKGKNDKFSDWAKDQSSSKKAGVEEGAEVFSYEHKEVKEQLKSIKEALEKGQEDNPEINTFGFPPAAVVGFLVMRFDDNTKKSLQAAKDKMSEKEKKRSIPVFTWEKKGKEDKLWELILLEII